MNLNNQLLKAESEIKHGLKDKAAKRLNTVLNNFPDSMEAREMLAQMYYEAGFLDAAGRYWMLTESHNDSHIKECVEIYKRSVNYSEQQILKDLKFRGDKTGLPEYAVIQLNNLEKAAREKAGFRANYNKSTVHGIKQKQEIRADKMSGYIGLAILAAILLCFLAGLVSVLQFIVGLLTSD